MIERLRDPERELRRIGVNPSRRHRAVCLLVLAGPTDDGEGHAGGDVAELEHALSIDHALLKNVDVALK
jgi:hypothetical protein